MTPRRRLFVVAAAAAVYAIAAWGVRPGFYDGTCPSVSNYLWLVPPPGVKPTRPPAPAHTDTNNSRGPYFAATTDPNVQAQLSWVPNAFDAPSTASVSVDVKPVNACPAPSGIRFTTNVYQVSTSARLVKDANLRLVLPGDQPTATTMFRAGSDCRWQPISGATVGFCGDISAPISEAGYFAAGVSASPGRASATHVGNGGQLLPLIVAAGIVLVLLAGLPLTLARRRPARRVGPRRRSPPRT